MGWSCSKAAHDVLDAITRGCVDTTGTQNVFVDDKGQRYFFENSLKEHPDGAITGSIWREISDPPKRIAHKVGAFRIDGDGEIKRMPRAMLDLFRKYRERRSSR